MLPGELVTVIVVAGFTFSAYSYRRFDTVQAEGEIWLGEYFGLQAARQADSLADVIRFTLPDLVTSYFATTPPEDPVPMDEPALVGLTQAIRDDPAAAQYLERHRLTEPATRAVLGSMRERLGELTPSVVVTPAVIEGLLHLRQSSVDATTAQRRLGALSYCYFAQCVLGVLFAVATIGYAIDVPMGGYVAAALLALGIGSAAFLEVARDRLRRSLRMEKTTVELARP